MREAAAMQRAPLVQGLFQRTGHEARNRLTEVAAAFGPGVLGVDAAVADAWGRIASRRSVPVVERASTIALRVSRA